MKYVSNGDGSTYARWHPLLSHSGPYEVLVFIPASHATTTQAPYLIGDLDGAHSVTIDQSGYSNEWVNLGVYNFRGNSDLDYVQLSNDTGEATGSTEVAVDTIKFRQYRLYLPIVLKRWPPIPYTPILNPINNPSYASGYTVDWEPAELADTYTLQEATIPDFSDAVTGYTGADTSWEATGKTVGTYYYRVKATNSWGDSSWSNVEPTIVLPTIFHSTKDATILQGYPDTNFWNTGDMWAGYDPSLDPDGEIARSLLGFNLSTIPADTSISQATLWLYMACFLTKRTFG